MRPKAVAAILLAFIGLGYGQEQFKTGNIWSYLQSFLYYGGPSTCIGGGSDTSGGYSVRLLNAISNVDCPIKITAEIRDSTFNKLVDTGEYSYAIDSIRSSTHTSSAPGAFFDKFMHYLVIPSHDTLDTVGSYAISGIPYAILRKIIVYGSGNPFEVPTSYFYLYLQNIGILYYKHCSGWSEHGGSCSKCESYSLKAFNNVAINSDSLFNCFQTAVKNSRRGSHSNSRPTISVTTDGWKIIFRSIQFVGRVRIEFINLQGRKVISRDLVVIRPNEMTALFIHKLPEGLYIINAYDRDTDKKIASIKMIR
jgi:hypothetical protein